MSLPTTHRQRCSVGRSKSTWNCSIVLESELAWIAIKLVSHSLATEASDSTELNGGRDSCRNKISGRSLTHDVLTWIPPSHHTPESVRSSTLPSPFGTASDDLSRLLCRDLIITDNPYLVVIPPTLDDLLFPDRDVVARILFAVGKDMVVQFFIVETSSSNLRDTSKIRRRGQAQRHRSSAEGVKDWKGPRSETNEVLVKMSWKRAACGGSCRSPMWE